MSTPHPMVKCHATNRDGATCGHWAMHGQAVCHIHGGKSPQALKKADERMRDLVYPAISSLSRLVDKADSDTTKLSAIRYVLDWAGFKAVERQEVTGADGEPVEHTFTLRIDRGVRQYEINAE